MTAAPPSAVFASSRNGEVIAALGMAAASLDRWASTMIADVR